MTVLWKWSLMNESEWVLISTYRQFIEEIAQILSSLENENSECIIVDDLNIKLLKVNEKEVFGEFFDALTENSFYPKITLPTRFSNKHGILIDNLFCKLTDKSINTTSGILIKTFLDHQPCFMFMNDINHKKKTKNVFIKVKAQSAEAINVKINIQNG